MKKTTLVSMNYLVTTFNILFNKDVEMAYAFLKEEMRAPEVQEQDRVPVKLADGQTVYVSVGSTSSPKFRVAQ